MLDQTFLQENLFKLVAHTLPKRGRTCAFNIFDFNFNRPTCNSLGFYIDPKPFEGKVVAYDLENNFMVVKKGRQARFSVIELDRDPIKIEEIYFDQLGEVLEGLIDDKSWQKIEVIELK